MVEGEQDPVAVRAAQILVGLRHRQLREPPEWAPMPPPAAEASSAAAAAQVPEWWPRQPRSRMARPRGDWKKASRELGLAAAAVGSGAWPGQEGGSGAAGSWALHAAAAAAKEAMKAPSPDTPLDYGAGGSGASSSADGAEAKRRARGSGGAASSLDDEGCSSPAKRARVAEEEEPIPAAEPPRTQSETPSSGGKAKGLAIDLNLPWPHDDEDGGGCPDAC